MRTVKSHICMFPWLLFGNIPWEPHLYVSLAFIWKHSVTATFGCFPGYYLETILQFSLYGWHQGIVWNTKGIEFYNNYVLNHTIRIVGGPHPTHAIFCILFFLFFFLFYRNLKSSFNIEWWSFYSKQDIHIAVSNTPP